MKIALVHDWINGMRGGERCLDSFLLLYPEADVFTLFHVPGASNARIDARVKQVSWLNRIPGSKRLYRHLLPLFPLAIRSFDFTGYDLVISLSHAAAKNVRVPHEIPHITYCFTPMRYIWDQARSYFGALTTVLWPAILALRAWDRRGAGRVTAVVGISRFVAARIRCFYRRKAAVIYPPVDTAWIQPIESAERGEAFLYAGALVPYKKVELLVQAFNQLGEPLWIVGTGPLESRLKAIAAPNIRFFGWVSDEELAGYYRRCRALLFPGTEDFGMIPIECMAAGRPVIGIDDGACSETLLGVRHWIDSLKTSRLAVAEATGVFIRRSREAELEELLAAVKFFIDAESEFRPDSCVRHAQRFSPRVFRNAWFELLDRAGVPRPTESDRSSDAVGYA